MPETQETQETLVRVVAAALEARRQLLTNQAVVLLVIREGMVKGQALVLEVRVSTWITVMRVLLEQLAQAELQEQVLLRVVLVIQEQLDLLVIQALRGTQVMLVQEPRSVVRVAQHLLHGLAK